MTCVRVRNGKKNTLEFYLKINSFYNCWRKMSVFFQNWQYNRFFHLLWNMSLWRAKIKNIYKQRFELLEQLFIIIPGSPSIATAWVGLRGFMAFKISNCEMRGNCKMSPDKRPQWQPLQKYSKRIGFDICGTVHHHLINKDDQRDAACSICLCYACGITLHVSGALCTNHQERIEIVHAESGRCFRCGVKQVVYKMIQGQGRNDSAVRPWHSIIS